MARFAKGRSPCTAPSPHPLPPLPAPERRSPWLSTRGSWRRLGLDTGTGANRVGEAASLQLDRLDTSVPAFLRRGTQTFSTCLLPQPPSQGEGGDNPLPDVVGRPLADVLPLGELSGALH